MSYTGLSRVSMGFESVFLKLFCRVVSRVAL